MKPYAWVSLPENEIQILPFPDDGKTLVAGDGFYLYTHPAELTNEEILKLADETCLTAWIAINPIMDIEKQKEIAKQKMIDFARAILRKAQEK